MKNWKKLSSCVESELNISGLKTRDETEPFSYKTIKYYNRKIYWYLTYMKNRKNYLLKSPLYYYYKHTQFWLAIALSKKATENFCQPNYNKKHCLYYNFSDVFNCCLNMFFFQIMKLTYSVFTLIRNFQDG